MLNCPVLLVCLTVQQVVVAEESSFQAEMLEVGQVCPEIVRARECY